MPRLYVLAGANGAGKSSIAGATFERESAGYFNRDEAARLMLAANPGISLAQANAEAWQQGKRLLERAIAQRLDFAFETTLGGTTIARLLQKAIASGVELRVWFVGLNSPELHIARVRARVERGGHPVPESKIRERYDSSRLNLVRLLPGLTALRVYDNSTERDPHAGKAPTPQLILQWERGRVVEACDLALVPEWAKPIVAAALHQFLCALRRLRTARGSPPVDRRRSSPAVRSSGSGRSRADPPRSSERTPARAWVSRESGGPPGTGPQRHPRSSGPGVPFPGRS
ncbi:MAG: zeta toxin family protein [Gemmatimonadetes bacterium]|nr:zeta toxin family protein [Gemmatimonadota bacterium]